MLANPGRYYTERGMDQQKLEYFRKLLEDRLKELRREAERTVAGMTSGEENPSDLTDRAALESDRNFLLRIRDRERKLIAKIEEALARIEDGTYGICEACGEEIGEQRLKARPVTTLCIECKKRQEAAEKARGG